ncbi:hypothetical protein CHLRE_04g218526v5 [Chlamydomonas reinhardtii]|uniref:BTB domain-containing protein n=1 Tax=Chlamydomonas reinhardtii TaxID=3055 RepID=A0A2K3DU37_CHLRE|nr:uncharacterized protein CHLRE_04g218526v5 [Chlamydomonas reinhardtii]PNW84035.1 hypothetical protein CHLRE_04g218526v5 [Chlamydomonas reinhardtii]
MLSDSAADWKLALALLQHRGNPLQAISWSNVAGLCHLADKYDMPAVRNYCAWFLTANVYAMSLTAPLASPQNLLHAASLLERYFKQATAGAAGSGATAGAAGSGATAGAAGSGATAGAGGSGAGDGGGSGTGGGGGGLGGLQAGVGCLRAGGGGGGGVPQHVAPICMALATALRPLTGLSLAPQPQPQPQPLGGLLSTLRGLTAHPAYCEVVAPGVQAQVVSALTAGLDQMLTAATQPCRGCGSNPLNGKR